MGPARIAKKCSSNARHCAGFWENGPESEDPLYLHLLELTGKQVGEDREQSDSSPRVLLLFRLEVLGPNPDDDGRK